MKAGRFGRRVLLGAVALGALGGVGMAVAPPLDIRPEGMAGTSGSQARQLLQALAQTHGGDQRWRASRAARVQLRDHWPQGLMKLVGSPWKAGESLDLTFLTARDMGRLTFRGGERDGLVWGIQHWQTYTETPKGVRAFAPDDTIKFWLPTIQYFVEMPFRIGEADVVRYAGEQRLDDTPYDKVFATWHDPEPQPDVDQYVLWINRGTGRLDYAQYTVRDMGKLIEGCMRFEDFRDIDGFTIPFKMTAGGSPSQPRTMHRFELQHVALLPELDEATILVDPARRGTK